MFFTKINPISESLQWPLLLTWVKSNPRKDQLSYGQQSMGWNLLSIYNFNGVTDEVWERISNIIPRFIIDVISYPCYM